jgi:hypothetical protein
VADVFNAVSKKFTFLQLESDTVFKKDITHTAEIGKQRRKDGRPEKDVVNDNAAAKVRRVRGVPKVKEGVPFVLENTHHRGVESRGVAGSKRHDGESILFVVGSEESELGLILGANGNLMIAGLVVETDKIEPTGRVAEIINSVVASGNRVFEWEGYLVEASVGDAHAPDEVGDVSDVFLVRFGGEDNRGAPGALADADPTVVQKDMEVFHDDLAFVGSVVRFAAAYGRRAAGIDTKFEIENGEANAGRIKTVPMRLDNCNDGGADRGGSGGVDNEILREFSGVTGLIPEVDIGTGIDERDEGLVDSTTVTFEEENGIVNVIAVIEGNVAIIWFWSPYFGWNFDDEERSDGRGGRGIGERRRG